MRRTGRMGLPSSPAKPESAAKTIGLMSTPTLKVESQGMGFKIVNPARQGAGHAGSALPGLSSGLKLGQGPSPHPQIKFRKFARADSLPNFAHGVKVKVQVMPRGKNRREHFPGHKKVAQIRARIAAPHRARTGRVMGAFFPPATPGPDHHLP